MNSNPTTTMDSLPILTTKPESESAPTEPSKPFTETHEGVMAKWDSAATCVKTSLDRTKPRERAMISACLDQADLGIVKAAGDVFEIAHYFAHVVDLVGQDDGEIRAKIRLVMICSDGRLVSTVSESFIKTFSLVIAMFGPRPWNPLPLIKVNLRKGSSGHNYATCVEVIREDHESETAKNVKKTK